MRREGQERKQEEKRRKKGGGQPCYKIKRTTERQYGNGISARADYTPSFTRGRCEDRPRDKSNVPTCRPIPPPPSQAMFRHRTHWLLFGARPCPHFLSLHSSSLCGKLGARWYVHVSSRMPYATPIPAGVEGVSVRPCDDVTPSYDGQLARQARTPDAIPRCEV